MNIFIVDHDPEQAARDLCDRHCVKMVLESAQLLSNAIHLNGGTGPLKLTHAKHPCTLWTARTKRNYDWLVLHWLGLLKEYSRRFERIHAYSEHRRAVYDGWMLVPDGPLTPHPQCMPEQYMRADPVDAYRAYYLGEKMGFARWAHGARPGWVPK